MIYFHFQMHLLQMSLELLRSPSLLSYIIYNKPETALYLSVLTVAYCGIVGHGVPQVTTIICFISFGFHDFEIY